MADISQYVERITSEHRKPDFQALMAAVAQGLVDNQNVLASLPEVFDIDTAVGAQLDVVGQWVGVSRTLQVPLTGVFFSWDTNNLGWDQGQWQAPYQSGNTLYALADDDYRLLLKARIASNHWDGTVPGAYAVWAIAFGPLGYTFLLQDNQDMSMDIIVIGPPLSAVERALLTGGLLTLKPAGVRINGYYVSSINGPIFGFDIEGNTISGWDEGGWAIPA